MFKWFWEAVFVLPDSDRGYEVHSIDGFGSTVEAYANLRNACDDGSLLSAGVPEGARTLDIILTLRKVSDEQASRFY